MKELFYQDEQMVALLDTKVGEVLHFIGLNIDAKGNMTIHRHITQGGIKFIDSYIFKDGQLTLAGRQPLSIQLSHDVFLNKYRETIMN